MIGGLYGLIYDKYAVTIIILFSMTFVIFFWFPYEENMSFQRSAFLMLN